LKRQYKNTKKEGIGRNTTDLNLFAQMSRLKASDMFLDLIAIDRLGSVVIIVYVSIAFHFDFFVSSAPRTKHWHWDTSISLFVQQHLDVTRGTH
jgi:hypothetical protein